MVLLFWLFHVFAITNWSLDNFHRFNTLLLLSSDLFFPSLCTPRLKPNFSFYFDSYCVILIFKQLLQYSMHFYYVFFWIFCFTLRDVQKFWFAFWDENILKVDLLKMPRQNRYIFKIMNRIFRKLNFQRNSSKILGF